MPEAEHQLTYFLLRYAPNIVRGEFVNLGVFLYDPTAQRFESRLLDDFRHIRRLHPTADLNLLARLAEQFEQEIFEVLPTQVLPEAGMVTLADYIARLQTYSNLLEFTPPKAVLTRNFDAELDRLYETYVREPRYPTRLAATMENTRAWVRAKLNAALRTAGLLARLERRVSVAAFTQPGDPFAFDFGYRTDSRRGFIHALALGRELDRAKVVAYTAERVRTRLEADKLGAEFTAVVEAMPTLENAGAQVSARILSEQEITLVPVAELARYVASLRETLVEGRRAPRLPPARLPRRHPRYSYSQPIELVSEQTHAKLSASTANISRGGVFVSSRVILPVGHRVWLSLLAGDKPLEALAVVRHAREGIGMGLEFEQLGPTSQSALGTLIDMLAAL